jgi:hypothetical protein
MTDKIYIGIDNKKIEAKGEALEQILKDRAEFEAEQQAKKLEQSRIEAETTAKAQAKESAMAKLRKLGLTDDEIAGLIS